MFLMMAEVLQLSRVAAAFPGNWFWSFLALNQTHVDWAGCSLHDTIQPGFSFLVGVALPYSIASRLAFDEAKLSWELDFFVEHYFGSLRGETLRHAEAAELKAELNDISAELSAAPRVLCHRDFHAANLMIDGKNNLRVVDHQDARMGPSSYDLVSFLLDRQPTPPSLAELRAHRLFFLEERRLQGLSALDPDDFAREFRLMTIQRGLKATGTFSYQTAVAGRGTAYEQFIQPTLEIILQAADWLERFPTLRRMMRERLN